LTLLEIGPPSAVAEFVRIPKQLELWNYGSEFSRIRLRVGVPASAGAPPEGGTPTLPPTRGRWRAIPNPTTPL